MTSEELELSLKAEFENYLNGTLEGIRHDVAEFQKTFEAEFAKHRSQMDEAISALSARFESSPALDRGFAETVVEHLRLARDEGAQLAASAFSEAEKLEEASTPAAKFDELAAAVADISGRVTQVEILSSLIEHASKFAPRGMFFIVKNDSLVGWRSFGEPTSSNVDVKIPISGDTLVGSAVNDSLMREGGYADNSENEQFLSPLGLGRPDRMYAIPLIARGRSVAVLYADYGMNGVSLNADALQTLVRVAGLTVELRAATRATIAHAEPQHAAALAEQPASAEDQFQQEEPSVSETEATAHQFETQVEEVQQAYEPEQANVYEFQPPSVEAVDAVEYTEATVYEERVEEPQPEHFAATSEPVNVDSFEPAAEVEYEAHEVEVDYQAIAEPEAAPEEVPESSNGFAFSEPAPEPAVAEPQFETVPQMESYTGDVVAEHVTAQAGRTRLSDRNIDLPIEVSDEERKLHNNARRFARLLVSEIKLYNEQKVTEGRDAGDLYDRLREAIDRSRDMYDRRVEPQVAAKFDYFHYELLNDLAGGEVSKLGASYPGAVV